VAGSSARACTSTHGCDWALASTTAGHCRRRYPRAGPGRLRRSAFELHGFPKQARAFGHQNRGMCELHVHCTAVDLSRFNRTSIWRCQRTAVLTDGIHVPGVGHLVDSARAGACGTTPASTHSCLRGLASRMSRQQSDTSCDASRTVSAAVRRSPLETATNSS